jgi:hypothetical protein
MAETSDPKQLERMLERASMPPGYDSASDYTRLQQFQARVVETMATAEGNVHPAVMQIGKNRTMAVDLKGKTIVDGLEVEVRWNDSKSIPFMFSVEDPNDVAKYIKSLAYFLDVKWQIDFLDFSINAYNSSDSTKITPLNGMYKQFTSMLAARPKVFKKVYGDSVALIHRSVQPILPILSTLEDSVLATVFNPKGDSSLGGHSRRYELFARAHEGALRHLSTLE